MCAWLLDKNVPAVVELFWDYADYSLLACDHKTWPTDARPIGAPGCLSFLLEQHRK